jgi:hypothetical protein
MLTPIVPQFQPSTEWSVAGMTSSSVKANWQIEHLSSSLVFRWVHVVQSLVFCVVFCRSLFVLLVIVLSVVPFMVSDYPFGIFWSLYCLSFHLWFLITSLVSFGHCIVCRSIWLPLWYLLIIVLSVVPSDYLFGIFWSLYCLSFHLITSLVSFGHCIVCRSIWLPLWYLQSFLTSVLHNDCYVEWHISLIYYILVRLWCNILVI